MEQSGQCPALIVIGFLKLKICPFQVPQGIQNFGNSSEVIFVLLVHHFIGGTGQLDLLLGNP